ncbi:Phosphinothricin N-acetyltransferase [Luteitalea pratensis]|uniref:Phosphinothricin N-acetyltransferase n=1 Tax=Luteitalea pratensis TaxID=1855912 RepID=A0A143PVK1_LUTPR|nr:arsinothricin resistance N-acetyltransferase ArsN1 family B [Luteitalea pratensis]AMY12411.1 Phosphinothricin N-acetyltransferase [Luteitalea pratensis]
MTGVTIRAAEAGDAPALARIYNHYVRETIVTFEEMEVSFGEMGARLAAITVGGLPWLVAAHDGKVCGYAYASPWRPRSAYRFSVETTVYLDPGITRSGIGSCLYADLLGQLEALGLHAALGGIALPNAASIALHEKFGFRKVAHLTEVGLKFGNWIDVGFWQRLLSASGETPR